MYAVKPYFSHEIVISAKSNPMYSVKPYYDDCQVKFTFKNYSVNILLVL